MVFEAIGLKHQPRRMGSRAAPWQTADPVSTTTISFPTLLSQVVGGTAANNSGTDDDEGGVVFHGSGFSVRGWGWVGRRVDG